MRPGEHGYCLHCNQAISIYSFVYQPRKFLRGIIKSDSQKELRGQQTVAFSW